MQENAGHGAPTHLGAAPLEAAGASMDWSAGAAPCRHPRMPLWSETAFSLEDCKNESHNLLSTVPWSGNANQTFGPLRGCDAIRCF